MQFVKNYSSYILLIGVLFLVGACSNNYVDDIKRGSGYNYQPGYPELRLEVAGIIDPFRGAKIQIAGSIPYNSLIFKRSGDSLLAEIKVSFDVQNVTTGKAATLDQSLMIFQDPQKNLYNDDLFLFEKEFDATPGNYKVNVTVMDLASQKVTLREDVAYIPDPETKKSNITNIRILAKYEESANTFFPVTTYDVNSSADSLKFQFQVTNNNPSTPISFEARLIRFDSDTSIAQQMSFNNYSASSIEYKGIDYDQFEVIQSTRRDLNQPGNVNVEYVFKNLERGNYRFEVSQNLQEKGPLYKARDFAIKSKNYPSVKSPMELARPLAYLMNDKEYDDLMSIKDPDKLKKAMDRFWLSNIQNSALAKNVISLFYERVEEANKMFSNYKEGWKTDRGMVYILFGPPLDTYQRLREVRWSYKYNETDPEYTYYFRSVKTKTDFYPFDNYILRRSSNYFQVEYRIRERWLSGSIINRPI